jgi:hypothetical protein
MSKIKDRFIKHIFAVAASYGETATVALTTRIFLGFLT